MAIHRGTAPTVLVVLMAGIMMVSGPLAYGGAGYDYDDRSGMDSDYGYGDHDGMDYDYRGHDGMYDYDKDKKYEMYPMPDASGKYAPPLQQLKSGVPIQNVQCNDPLVLYIRDSPSPDDLMAMADMVTVMIEGIVSVMAEDVVAMMMEDMDAMAKDEGEMMNDHMMMKEDMGVMMDEMMNDPMMSEIVEKMESSAVLCIRDSTAETMMSRGIDLTSFDVLEPTVYALMDAMEASFMNAMEASFMDAVDKILRGLIHDAIETYDMNSGNLDVLTESSTDDLYVFVTDLDYVVVAHGADPALVGNITLYDVNPSPPVDEIDPILAKEGEAWASYMSVNPATGEDEYKKSLLILHDGYIFAAGYYMPDHTDKMKPYGGDMDKTLRGLIHDAIETYDMNSGNLDVLTKTGTDDLYVFVTDLDYVVVAHGADPALVDNITLYDVNPSPPVDEIDQILAKEGEAWASYMFVNPATGEDEYKKSLLILHDGYIFVAGYYMPDHTDKMKPYGGDMDKTLRGLIHDAIETYDMNSGNLDVLTKTGTDELYVFVTDLDYVVVAHGADPALVDNITLYDVNPSPPVDEIDQILAKEGEAWASYMFVNPATGEDEYKKSLLILHDGYIFVAGYYMSED